MMSGDDQENAAFNLRDRCVLIVEDDYFIASDLSKSLARRGIAVLGPVPSLVRALALVEARAIDAALLDINLDGEMVYGVADALVERDVPVVFVTGYDASVIPDRFAAVPMCQKPVDVDAVLAILRQVISG